MEKEIKKKDKFKGLFRSKTIKTTRNLDYKEGGKDLLSGQKLRTCPCPVHQRDYFFNDVWVRWKNKPLRLVKGEYQIIN